MIYRFFAAILLLAVSFLAPANAETDNMRWLVQAQADSAARNLANDGVRFGYTVKFISHGTQVKSKTKDANEFVLRFDPSMEKDQQWAILTPNSAENAKNYEAAQKKVTELREQHSDGMADQSLIFGKEVEDVENVTSKDSKLYFLRNEADMAIYGSPILTVNNQTGTGQRMAKKILKVMATEFSVNTSTNLIQFVRIYAKKGFKPLPIAKINKMNVLMEYAPVWEGGPLVKVNMQQDIAGSALFQKFVQRSEEIYSDFERK